MSVQIAEFTNKKGRIVKYLSIDGEKYPTKIGFKKARKVLENAEAIRTILEGVAV